MATNTNRDPLRNPQVDYERADLSPRGILLFLIGLFIAGVFIELVIWGMFRFMAHSTLFAQGNPSPLVQMQKAMPETVPGLGLQNTGQVNTERSRSCDCRRTTSTTWPAFCPMRTRFSIPSSRSKTVPGQFTYLIDQAMAPIVERGLPVLRNTPPRDFNAPMQRRCGEGAGHGRQRAGRSRRSRRRLSPLLRSSSFC